MVSGSGVPGQLVKAWYAHACVPCMPMHVCRVCMCWVWVCVRGRAAHGCAWLCMCMCVLETCREDQQGRQCVRCVRCGGDELQSVRARCCTPYYLCATQPPAACLAACQWPCPCRVCMRIYVHAACVRTCVHACARACVHFHLQGMQYTLRITTTRYRWLAHELVRQVRTRFGAGSKSQPLVEAGNAVGRRPCCGCTHDAPLQLGRGVQRSALGCMLNHADSRQLMQTHSGTRTQHATNCVWYGAGLHHACCHHDDYGHIAAAGCCSGAHGCVRASVCVCVWTNGCTQVVKGAAESFELLV